MTAFSRRYYKLLNLFRYHLPLKDSRGDFLYNPSLDEQKLHTDTFT